MTKKPSDSAYCIIQTCVTGKFFLLRGKEDGMLWNVGQRLLSFGEKVQRADEAVLFELRDRFHTPSQVGYDRLRDAGSYVLSNGATAYALQTIVPENFSLLPRSERIAEARVFSHDEIRQAYLSGSIRWGQLRMILEWRSHSKHHTPLPYGEPLKDDFTGYALGSDDWKRPV